MTVTSTEKYFITIAKLDIPILQMPFIAENDEDAVDKMNKLVVIWCDTLRMKDYNINLYKLNWINEI